VEVDPEILHVDIVGELGVGIESKSTIGAVVNIRVVANPDVELKEIAIADGIGAEEMNDGFQDDIILGSVLGNIYVVVVLDLEGRLGKEPEVAGLKGVVLVLELDFSGFGGGFTGQGGAHAFLGQSRD
jgi:hypothetical protein